MPRSSYRPLTGIAHHETFYTPNGNKFSPPYGDCTELVQHESVRSVVIAPLRGLYGIAKTLNLRNFGFAPLRGWYGISEFCRICLIVIAPLRGWYFLHMGSGSLLLVFAPLRGWYGISEFCRICLIVIAPLRGWYFLHMGSGSLLLVFAPLRGWYTKYITKHRKTEESDGWKIFTLLQ